MDNILIIGAHFDDTELGVGGTAAKLVNDGKKVFKLTLTDNVTRFHHHNILVEYETSSNQSKKACDILGVTELYDFKPIECSQLKYSTELMQSIENLIFKHNIDTVFLHYSHDMNQDHIEASKLCTTAARHCENILAYQSNGYILDTDFYPRFFVDVSGYIHRKISALSQYGEEHNRFNQLFQMCIKRNEIWGFANKVKYAEGFDVIKMLTH